MKRYAKRILIASTGVFVAALATAALYPQLARVEGGGQRRSTSAQKAWMERVDPLVEKGEKAMAVGDYTTAESAFESAIDQWPENHALFIHLARLYDRQGRDQKALGTYKSLVSPYQGSSAYQTDPRVLARYGDLLAKFGNKEEASKIYLATTASAESAPVDSKIATLGSAAHTAAGERSLVEGNAKDAAREMALALRASPTDWRAQYYLGIAKSKLGNQEGAASALKAAEARAPEKELAGMRRRRSMLGIGQGAKVSVITISGKKAALKEVPASLGVAASPVDKS